MITDVPLLTMTNQMTNDHRMSERCLPTVMSFESSPVNECLIIASVTSYCPAADGRGPHYLLRDIFT